MGQDRDQRLLSRDAAADRRLRLPSTSSYRRSRPEADEPAGDLVRRREEAHGESLGDGAPGPEAPALRHRGRGRHHRSGISSITWRTPATAIPGRRRTAGNSTPPIRPSPRPSANTGASISAWTRGSPTDWLGGFSYTWSRLTGNYSGLASSDEYQYRRDEGRNSPNVERNFDTWYLAYDKNLNPIDGPLATDRPHVFKLYGAYTFPFRPDRRRPGQRHERDADHRILEPRNDEYMPYNRGNLGRTPFLWFANLYAEYSLRMGKTSLSFQRQRRQRLQHRDGHGLFSLSQPL